MARLIHIYGGVILVGLGLSLESIAAGIFVGGALLIWLGLKWVRE